MEEWDEQDWRHRLESSFTLDGLVGGLLTPIIQAEDNHKLQVVSNYQNFNYISDSFLAFFVETLVLAENLRQESVRETKSYGSALLSFVVTFRQLRAAQNAALTGYPQQGYALLRDLKDRAIEFAAWANRLSTLEKTAGLEDIQPDKFGDNLSARLALNRKITGARKKEWTRVRKLMLGEPSGLGKEDRKALNAWSELFHQEIHGARLTAASIGSDWISGRGRLPILPDVDDLVMALYQTHATEIAWMVHRTLPFLQLCQAAFPTQWAEKWSVLDSCFRDFMVALMEGRAHAVIPAFIRWIDLKFSFSPPSTFYTELC